MVIYCLSSYGRSVELLLAIPTLCCVTVALTWMPMRVFLSTKWILFINRFKYACYIVSHNFITITATVMCDLALFNVVKRGVWLCCEIYTNHWCSGHNCPLFKPYNNTKNQACYMGTITPRTIHVCGYCQIFLSLYFANHSFFIINIIFRAPVQLPAIPTSLYLCLFSTAI